MDERPNGNLSRHVARKELRKLKGRRDRGHGIWYGLGMFGLVGWSIAVPTLIGVAIGVWIDRKWTPGFSCTLTGLSVGVAAGCAIAWYWVKRESVEEGNADSPTIQSQREHDDL